MARHAAPPRTLDAIVDDYVTGRARELIRQFDRWQAQPPDLSTANWHEWTGQAVEVLRELTRDA